MKQTRVTVYKAETGWVVRYMTGPRAELIQHLFGTDILPLPYTAEMPLAEVAAQFVRSTSGVASFEVGLAGVEVILN